MGRRATRSAGPLKVAVSIPDTPLDFVLFALTLVGLALFHRHTLKVAMAGCVAPRRAYCRFLVLPDVAVDSSDKVQREPQVSVTGKFIDTCTRVKLSRNAAVPYNNIDVCIRSGYTRP